LKKKGITILPAVPYILNTLAETPSNIQADLSTLRLCFSAGNFLSKDIFEKFFRDLEFLSDSFMAVRKLALFLLI
jgi:long-chain acyl-CoA synthetase